MQSKDFRLCMRCMQSESSGCKNKKGTLAGALNGSNSIKNYGMKLKDWFSTVLVLFCKRFCKPDTVVD